MHVPFDRGQIEDAVACVCSEVARRQQPPKPWQTLGERDLWQELVGCVLASRVRFEIALEATRAVLEELPDPSSDDACLDDLEARLITSLCEPGCVSPGRRYPFPKSRARWISATVSSIYGRGLTLKRVLSIQPCPQATREAIVGIVTGMGPKESSLFLRNIGYCNDLAVLDTHVLRFMRWVGLLKNPPSSLARLADYEDIESILLGYARQIGLPIGLLDLGIWIVSRVVQEAVR